MFGEVGGGAEIATVAGRFEPSPKRQIQQWDVPTITRTPSMPAAVAAIEMSHAELTIRLMERGLGLKRPKGQTAEDVLFSAASIGTI